METKDLFKEEEIHTPEKESNMRLLMTENTPLKEENAELKQHSLPT